MNLIEIAGVAINPSLVTSVGRHDYDRERFVVICMGADIKYIEPQNGMTLDETFDWVVHALDSDSA